VSNVTQAAFAASAQTNTDSLTHFLLAPINHDQPGQNFSFMRELIDGRNS
jgi:hypothetical protein